MLPVVGGDASAIRTAADTGDALVHGALRQLVAGADWRLADRLTPRHGRMDLHALRALAPTVRSVAGEFTSAQQRLGQVDAAGLSGFLRGRFESLRGQVDQAAVALAAADRAVRVLPHILGAHGPQTWLLVFDNNAEVRATGGMPGAAALVRTDHGRITLGQQATAGDFPVLKRPVIPLTRAERAIYDVHPGIYWQDANFTPEFPRSAEIWAARWRQRFGQRVDGVASVDAVTLSYLLRATGPVTVDGVRLTAADASSELLHRVYARLRVAAAQDAFFRDVARAMFHTVTTGVAHPSVLLGAIAQAVDEGRVHAHSFDPQVQRVVDPTMLAGNLDVHAGPHPQLGLWLNDATGSKMSWYLRTTTRVTSQRCVAGRQTLTATTTFRSTAPRDAARLTPYITGGGNYGTARGHQLVLARVYGPVGGALRGFRFAGRAVKVPTVDDRGRPVATTVVDLAPGQATRMTWQVTTGPHQPAATVLTQGPGMQARPARTTIRSSCG